jgi:hypothetical protein
VGEQRLRGGGLGGEEAKPTQRKGNVRGWKPSYLCSLFSEFPDLAGCLLPPTVHLLVLEVSRAWSPAASATLACNLTQVSLFPLHSSYLCQLLPPALSPELCAPIPTGHDTQGLLAHQSISTWCTVPLLHSAPSQVSHLTWGTSGPPGLPAH